MKSRLGPLLIVVLLLVLLAALLGLLAYPKILTGDFCDMTFEFQIASDTQVDLRYRTYASDKTDVLQETSTNGHMTTRTGRIHDGFLGRPSVHEERVRFPLASSEERRQGATDTPEMRRRLLVEQGKTYRIRDREKFVYYRNVEPNGTVQERYFVIHPLR